MAKRRKKKRKPSPGLMDFLFGSRVTVLLIGLNMGLFYALQRYEPLKELTGNFLLYPGSLLQGRLWTPITSGFIHSNLTHLCLNMLGVFIFGRIVERRLGPAKTLFVYFGALVISMLFATAVYALVLQRNVAIVGASGAVMGLLAAAMLLEPFCITFETLLPLPVMVKGWFFLFADFKGFLGGEGDGVSHLAHLFGFLSIAILVYFMSEEDKRKLTAGLLVNIVSFVVFLYLRKTFFMG